MKDSFSIPSRTAIIQAHKKRGGKVAAVLPYHYPRPLFTAFDILPIEIWGPPQVDLSYGSAHLQPYICSLVRNALSFLLTGGLDTADFIVAPHGCDSLQGMGSILMDFIHTPHKVLPFYVPRGEKENALGFLAEEIRSLYKKINKATGLVPDEQTIRESINQHQDADVLLSQLHSSRRNTQLSQHEFYRLIRSREYLPAPVFSDLARDVLSSGVEDSEPSGVPVLLSGIVPEPMSMFDALSQLGAFVVADDLACCSRRLYPPSSQKDVYMAIAESLIASPPDSTRGCRIDERIKYVLNLVKNSKAKGVIFLEIKFCEPELFYLPLLREALKTAGIASLVLETELNDPFTQQLRTRIEAFLEMLT